MTQKKEIKTVLLVGLFFISLGGWLLHMRIHTNFANRAYLIPAIAGILSVLIVPLFFCFKKTTHLAYILNGMIAIVGTIVMAHFSYTHFPKEWNLETLFLQTTLADIFILWAKFAMGKAVFDLHWLGSTDQVHGGKFFRYPGMGWWWVHLLGLGVVYALGHIVW